MAAYQVETRLLGLLGDHYARTADEGRTLLQAAFQSTGRIEVRGEELYTTNLKHRENCDNVFRQRQR